MIEIELSREEPWPDADWTALATRAVRAAIAQTPHGPRADTPALVEVSVRLTADDEAEAMEAIERDALSALGIADPYLIRED